MAKKTPAKAAAPKKDAAPRKKTTTNAKPSIDIVAVCTSSLQKLQELNLDYALQGEIEWCLGSYANDGNPIGLYQMAERALHNFRSLTESQPKAVPAKLIKDLEKAVKETPR